VKDAYEEGLIDKLVPGYSLNRFRKMRREILGDQETFFDQAKPKFRFQRDGAAAERDSA
jgi:ATP-dependent Clp protease, protease subunit